MKLGFIGYGEVSFEISRGLSSEGVQGIVAYDPMCGDSRFGPLVAERAALASVELLDSAAEVIAVADLVMAAVPGSKALTAAESCVGCLKAGQIYADVSTSSPTTKQAIAKMVEAAEALFVDGALMGSLPQQHHKVPTLVSGSGAESFIQLLQPYGMSLEKVSDKAGDAIAIKLVRSIYMKGIASLQIEMLEAATKLQVADKVLASIANTLDVNPFQKSLNWLVTAGAVHAERQSHEMKDCMTMLQDLSISPTMTQATAEHLRTLAGKRLKDRFGGKVPPRWEDVIAAMT